MPPYRSTVASLQLEAKADDGPVRLSIEPDYTSLELVDFETWLVTADTLTVIQHTKRRDRRKSLSLKDSQLFVTRAWPTNEISLWLEYKPGVVRRLLGIPPLTGLDGDVLKAWRDLDRLGTILAEALRGASGGAHGVEFGQGHHRVLTTQGPERLVVYARPMFRERPRQIAEVFRNGTVVTRKGRATLPPGAEVVASGGRISFCQPDGEEAAHIFLPWVGRAERVELAKRFLTQLHASETEEEPQPHTSNDASGSG